MQDFLDVPFETENEEATPPFALIPRDRYKAEIVSAKAGPTKNGKGYSVALNWSITEGDYENRTEWHRVYAWSNLSSFAKTLQKGQLITLEGKIKYREVSEEVEGVTFKHTIAEIHATSMKRLSKVEAADDPADGASEDDGAAQTEPEIIPPTKRRK